MTVTVPINGDTEIERSETFALLLSLAGSDLTTLAKGEGVATIVNDDSSTWVSGTLADLGKGTVGTGAYVADMSDGAVILQPRMANEFSGPTLPEGWTKNPVGTVTFTGGTAIVDGTQIQNAGGLYGNHTLEFAATFSGASQFMGTAQLRFNTKLDGRFFATTLGTKNQTVETQLPSDLLGTMHRFRIDWSPVSVVYSIDDKVVATHPVVYPLVTKMMAVANDLGPSSARDRLGPRHPVSAVGRLHVGGFRRRRTGDLQYGRMGQRHAAGHAAQSAGACWVNAGA